jgi:hypothetical protein
MTALVEPRARQVDDVGTDGARWRGLYRAGGVAALSSALFIPIQIAVFLVWPLPDTVAGWFRLLQENRLVGLVDLDLLLVADNLLLVMVLLALYAALRRVSPSGMAIATSLGLLGAVLFVVSNPAVEMLLLSERYAAAATAAQRAALLAAGEGLLATWQGTAFQVAYIVGSVAGIAVGVVMWRSGSFSRATAAMAILGNAVGLGLYVPTVGLYISVFSVVFLEVWYVLVARRLLQLGRGAPEAATAP